MNTLQCSECGRLESPAINAARAAPGLCPLCRGQLVPVETRPKRELEESVESYLVRRVREQGGEVRKVQWVGRKGAPDRLVMMPRPPHDEFGIPAPGTFWIELKRPGLAAKFPHNAHERQQHEEHERMRRMGQLVYVIDSKEGVDALLGIGLQ
jgi:hypothetical protein